MRNKHSLFATILTIAAIASAIASLTTVMPLMQAATAQQPDFASIQTFQNKEHIVITITKAGANATKPTGPIIVIPPTELTNKTGGVNESGVSVGPSENQTVSEPSAPGASNITTIEPSQNVTVIPMPPKSNITQIDNGTIIIAPPDRNITETPGNVSVIDPPAPTPAQPAQNCTCAQHPPAATTTPPLSPPAAANQTKPNATKSIM